MTTARLGIVLAIVLTSAAVCWILQSNAVIRWREKDDALRQQAAELERLTEENKRLAALLDQLKNSQSLSKEQLTEMLRLRGEIGQLRETVIEKKRLQATNAQLQSVLARSKNQLAEAQAAPNYWAKDQLAPAGYTTPESAVKSLLWMVQNGDVFSWLANCTPETRTQLEAEWNRDGRPEAQRMAEIKTMAQSLLAASEGFHIVDQKTTAPDEVVVNLSFDGEGVARKFVLRKIGNEWKFHNLILAGQKMP